MVCNITVLVLMNTIKRCLCSLLVNEDSDTQNMYFYFSFNSITDLDGLSWLSTMLVFFLVAIVYFHSYEFYQVLQ